MKLKDLLKRLNHLVDEDTSILEDDVVLSVEHASADSCDMALTGYSDQYDSNWILEYDEVNDWVREMGYDALDEAKEDARLRKIVMLR